MLKSSPTCSSRSMASNVAPLDAAEYGLVVAVTRGLADSINSEAARMAKLVEKSDLKSAGRELYWEGYIDGMRDAAADLMKKVVLL